MCDTSRAARFVAGWIQLGPDALFGARATAVRGWPCGRGSQAVGCLVPDIGSANHVAVPPDVVGLVVRLLRAGRCLCWSR